MTTPLLHIEINANSTEELAHALAVLQGQLGASIVVAPPGATTAAIVTPAAEGVAPAPTPASGKDDPSKDVTKLTPEEARDEGIKTLQTHIAANPADIAKVSQIQDKYNAAMLQEITDDRSHEFLADAKLVAANVEIAA